MFYIYSILLPFLILFLLYFIDGKPRIRRKIINYLFKSFIALIVYTLLLYFLEMENYIDSGWAVYSLVFFLVLSGVLIIPFKLYYLFKKEN